MELNIFPLRPYPPRVFFVNVASKGLRNSKSPLESTVAHAFVWVDSESLNLERGPQRILPRSTSASRRTPLRREPAKRPQNATPPNPSDRQRGTVGVKRRP